MDSKWNTSTLTSLQWANELVFPSCVTSGRSLVFGALPIWTVAPASNIHKPASNEIPICHTEHSVSCADTKLHDDNASSLLKDRPEPASDRVRIPDDGTAVKALHRNDEKTPTKDHRKITHRMEYFFRNSLLVRLADIHLVVCHSAKVWCG